MNLRFVQRQPGGPKLLQVQIGRDEWQDVPLVEEWRVAGALAADAQIHQGTTTPTMREALGEMFTPSAAGRRYHDSD